MLIFCTITSEAQDKVLIPWKRDNKFGLSDKDGKIVLIPFCSKINYIGGTYFQYTDSASWVETVTERDGRVIKYNHKGLNSGVLLHDKIIIQNQHFEQYKIINSAFIRGSSDGFYSINECMIFTFKGKPLLDQNVKYAQIVDTAGISAEGIARFFLIHVIHEDKSVSMLVFDKEKQVITDRILDHVEMFHLQPEYSENNSVYCSYFDLYRLTNAYIIFNIKAAKYEIANPGEPRIEEIENRINERNKSLKASAALEKNSPGSKTFERYFRLINSGLIFSGTPAGIPNADYFFNRYEKIQKEPLIYKMSRKFGLLISDSTIISPEYDSLVYVKHLSFLPPSSESFTYLAGKKDSITNTWKFGLLNAAGEVTIPVIYDSLFTKIPSISYGGNGRNPDVGRFTISTVPPNALVRETQGRLVAFRNNKFGIIDMNNNTILPFEYDGIYNYRTDRTLMSKTENGLIILKKQDLYGIAALNSKNEITTQTEIFLPKIPVSFFRNYYGVMNFTLFGLADEKSLQAGFMADDGTKYWD